MLKVTFIFISRDDPNQTWAVELPVDHRVAYEYFTKQDHAIVPAVKTILGIPAETKTVVAAHVDYLLHPETGEVLLDDIDEIADFTEYFDQARANFFADVEKTRRQMVAEAAYRKMPKIHVFMV